ncbi:hypothetical protein V0R50_10425 [Pseudomonas sp. 148P]|uniref:Uncharacterized protein n=1 Tax=Pseudomonas ulcerans TaxID=3115852 RepID=A0ABU7HQ20_9PSED|nr:MULTISPECIES: hypothetical protein [unclassified Pseudomonas]MEE1922659.1 hypothetical protein [Pseudomonas sp. 147P]MEE1933636.1 hypothetical protein [Pseudomonas sp. 148P]
MVVDFVLAAGAGLGAATVCFLAGMAAGDSSGRGSVSFPETHVSFDPLLPDEARLRFLERAADAVRSGRLSQAQQLKDERAGD